MTDYEDLIFTKYSDNLNNALAHINDRCITTNLGSEAKKELRAVFSILLKGLVEEFGGDK